MDNMSIKIMSKVWEMNIPTNEKMLLLALSDHANDDGLCYPSYDKLQIKCSFARSTVSANIKRLVDRNIIKKHIRNQSNGGRKTTIYEIDLSAQSSMAEPKPKVQPPKPKVQINTAQSSMAEPKPSYNHQYYLNHKSFVCMDEDEKNTYIEYVELRQKMKLNTTDKIHDRLLKKYFEFGRDIRVIENAITSNWKDFYKPKTNKFNKPPPPANSIEGMRLRMEKEQLDLVDVEVE
jgi:hypothetical protein